MATNLDVLHDITDQLPELNELETPIMDSVVAFRSDHSTLKAFGFGVHRDSDIGIMRVYVPKGVTIDIHQHAGEHEWIGIINGKLRFTFVDNAEQRELVPLEMVHIHPGRAHTLTGLEDTWCWVITIPPAAGFPPVSSSRSMSDEVIIGIPTLGNK